MKSPRKKMDRTHKSRITRVGWFLYDPRVKMACLHRRDHKAKSSKHTWDCFGGDKKSGENPEAALTRELCEELGIAVKKDKIRRIRNWKVSNQAMYCIYYPFSKKHELRLCEGAGFVWLPFELNQKSSIKEQLKLCELHENAIEALEKFQLLL